MSIDFTKLVQRDGYSLRHGKEEDIDQVFDLINEAYQVETGNTGLAFKKTNRLLDKEDAARFHMYLRPPQNGSYNLGAFLVLIDNSTSKIIGCIQIEEEVKDSKIGYFGPLAVSPNYQGKKLGVYLVDVAEQVCKQWNFKELCLVTANVRTDLITWYTKLGFIQTGTSEFIHLERVTRPVHFVNFSKKL